MKDVKRVSSPALLQNRLIKKGRSLARRAIFAAITAPPIKRLTGKTKQALAERGVLLFRHHFYLPIPEPGDVRFVRQTEMVGITIDPVQVDTFLESIVRPYQHEFAALPLYSANTPTRYHVINGSFMAIDGDVYYSLLRHFKPQKIIEIGAGNSTLLAIEALTKNQSEGEQSATNFICIDPYVPAYITNDLPQITQIIRQKLQDIDLSLFESLGSGDILFIDSSHVLRPGGDVWWEYCEILPRLAPGVIIHIHDISLPKPYPQVYWDNQLYWTEQYLLQAILAHSPRYEILWAGNYVMTTDPDLVRREFAHDYPAMLNKYPQAEPSSFWMRVRSNT